MRCPSGDAEVREQGVSLLVEHHVRRLDVSMHQADPVEGVERVPDVRDDANEVAKRQGPFCQALGEGLTRDELHRQVVPVAVLALIEQGDDMSVVELGRDLAFSLEPPAEHAVLG